MNICFWKQTTNPRKTEQILKALEAEHNYLKKRMSEVELRTAYLQAKVGQLHTKIAKTRIKSSKIK